jgi:hypothetical protein
MKEQFVICVCNDDYPASLERRKIYLKLADPEVEKYNYISMIDESGEGYLYPASYFVAIKLPAETERAIIEAA